MSSEKQYLRFNKDKYTVSVQAHLNHAWEQCNQHHQYDELPEIDQWISDIYIPACNDDSIPYSRNVVKKQINDLKTQRLNAIGKAIIWGMYSIILIALSLIIVLTCIIIPIANPELVNVGSCLLMLFIMILITFPFVLAAGYTLEKTLKHSYTVGADTLLIHELTECITKIV